jgi:hypothetical protein
MKVGIVGFTGCGKSTVFQWLTGDRPSPAAVQQGQIGIAKIPDDRLDWLSQHYRPRKTTPAELAFFDTPGLLAAERRDNPRRLGIIRDSDGLLVVLNGFSDGSLADELRRFRDELLFADLEIVGNRLAKLEDQIKKPRPAKQKEADQHEHALLVRIAKALEDQTVGSLSLREDEEKTIRSFQLLTLKPELVMANIGEERIGKALPADLLALAPQAMAIPARLECELEELSAEERQSFMQEMGLTGLSRAATLRTIYAAMGQIVFFTVGEDEVRAWGVPKGADAVTAAGQIHTDLARGFVRAEVVAYDDLRRLGSLKEARSHGVLRLEGKTYVLHDGEIMHVLHSG